MKPHQKGMNYYILKHTGTPSDPLEIAEFTGQPEEVISFSHDREELDQFRKYVNDWNDNVIPPMHELQKMYKHFDAGWRLRAKMR